MDAPADRRRSFLIAAIAVALLATALLTWRTSSLTTMVSAFCIVAMLWFGIRSFAPWPLSRRWLVAAILYSLTILAAGSWIAAKLWKCCPA